VAQDHLLLGSLNWLLLAMVEHIEISGPGNGLADFTSKVDSIIVSVRPMPPMKSSFLPFGAHSQDALRSYWGSSYLNQQLPRTLPSSLSWVSRKSRASRRITQCPRCPLGKDIVPVNSYLYRLKCK
jgi:hypothetical protein